MKTFFATAALLMGAVSFNQYTTMAQSVTTIERDGLKMHVFLSEPVIFQVTSVVLEGEREVALVDAQFSADNASRVVELIKSTGKKLTTIFISYSDPDYYFGLAHMAEQFPGARVIATPQTVYLINATKDDKMGVWAPQLGDKAPKSIMVPESITDDHFMLGDRRVEIRKAVGDEQHSYLWIPSVRTILGGVYVVSGEHLWVADSPTKADRDKWVAALDDMEALKPVCVVPAHFVPSGTGVNFESDAPIRFTKRYLTDLEGLLAERKGSAAIIAGMRALYPNLGGESNLDMTAKVLSGEMPWRVTAAFPPIGRKAAADFGGDYYFSLDFRDERHMTYTGLRGSLKGVVENVVYTAVEVASQVYMVYWTETDNTHVVHVEDYGSGVAYTNIAAPDGSFNNLRGTLRLL